MKNLIYLFTCIVLFTACTKKNTTPLKAGQSRFSFSVSGATSGNFDSDDKLSSVLSNGSYLNVSGSSVNLKTFTTELCMMLIPTPVTVGTIFNLSSMSTSDALPTFSYTKGSTGWAASPGENNLTLEITKVDGDLTEVTINGTFTYKE